MTNYDNEDLNTTEEVSYVDHIMSQYEKINKLPLDQRRPLRKIVDYAYKRGYHLGDNDSKVDLWGFGSVPVIMKDQETETKWISLKSLAEPTGIAEKDLIKIFRIHEYSKMLGEEDLIEINFSDPGRTVMLVTVSFAQLLFMEFSPWSTLYQYNIQKMILRELYLSGEYKHTVAKIYSKDDEGVLRAVGESSLADYFEEHGVPSEEEAIDSAYRGLSVEVFKGMGDHD